MWATSVDDILDRLKQWKGFKTDTQLARFLEVKRSAVSNWRHRGTVPFRILIEVCERERISPSWLFSGIGEASLDRLLELESEDRELAAALHRPNIRKIIKEVMCLDDEDIDVFLNAIREKRRFREMEYTLHEIRSTYGIREEKD